jgi:hypothetical protein
VQTEASRWPTPFDSIESAHDYVRLVVSEADAAMVDILDDVDALHLVEYKPKQLKQHLDSSS